MVGWIKMPLNWEICLSPRDRSLPQKGAKPPIFGPCLWPNGWMDHDATCYGGRPLPRWLCVWCAPSSPRKKGHSLHAISCGQMAGWMKMALGTEVDLSPSHIVLDSYPARPWKVNQKKIRPTTFVDMTAMHGNFCTKFYTIVKRSNIHFITKFYWNTSGIDKATQF